MMFGKDMVIVHIPYFKREIAEPTLAFLTAQKFEPVFLVDLACSVSTLSFLPVIALVGVKRSGFAFDLGIAGDRCRRIP